MDYFLEERINKGEKQKQNNKNIQTIYFLKMT